MDFKPLMALILERYELPPNGLHGVAHWARVLDNGLRLAPDTGAIPSVVTYFAILHDSQRINEGHDPDHGPRAARFAEEVRKEMIALDDHEFRLLVRACEGHTHERTHPDATIQTCWDSDRLDLGRVGITPHPNYLCTEFACQKETIGWAHGRACMDFIPDRVRDEWRIELD
jgi:uncharacterized protein